MTTLKSSKKPKVDVAKPDASNARQPGARAHLVRATRIPELVASDLRMRIVKGDLPEGSRLPPEAGLMAQYQVSRPTLREALRLLESDALIAVHRGGIGGATVQRPSLDSTARSFSLVLQMAGATIADVYRARMAIEPFAVADLARRASKAEVSQIAAGIERLQAAVGSAHAYAHVFTELRELTIAGSGNPTLLLLARLLDAILDRYTTRTAEQRGAEEWAQLQRKGVRSLQKLLTFVEAKDAAGAEQHWRRHLQEAGAELFKDERPIEIVDLLRPQTVNGGVSGTR